MTEDVLQYIWQTQSLQRVRLETSNNEVVEVLHPGSLNSGSGPDFSDARVSINGLTWSGDVEVHTYASHWDNHQHNRDASYDRVVLHVVWQEDRQIFRQDGSVIPTLELRHYLDEDWYERYHHLMNSIRAVPCEPYVDSVEKIVVTDAIQTALVSRLEEKSQEVLEILNQSRGDWEKTALVWLFSGFGFKKNKMAFQQLANSVDLAVLRKMNRQIQVEAYLFGLSGLIPSEPQSGYVEQLKQEFEWLDKKYDIARLAMSVSWWKFMRMRPANFPTVRLAQLASFLFHHNHILRTILEDDVTRLANFFNISHSEFWQSHYHFSKSTSKKSIAMGMESQENLLINVVAVLLVAYGSALGQSVYINKAIQLLENINSESNKIIRLWQSLGITPENAAGSQGLIGLFNDYCKKSRCLSCSIGKYIIKPQ